MVRWKNLKYCFCVFCVFLLSVISVNAQPSGDTKALEIRLDSIKTHLSSTSLMSNAETVEDQLNIAYLLIKLNRKDEVSEYLEAAEINLQKVDKERVPSIIRISNYWYFIDNFDKALSLIDWGIEDAAKVKDSLHLGVLYSNKSLYHTFAVGNIPTKASEEYLLVSLSYLQKPSPQRANTLYRLAETFYEKGSVDSADLFRDEFELIKDSVSALKFTSLKIQEYTAKGDFEAVDSMLLKQQEVYIEMNWGARIAYSYALLSRNALQLGDVDLAIERGKQGYDYATNKGLAKEHADILNFLIPAFESKGDYKSAFESMKELDSLKSSFRNISEQLAQKDLQKLKVEEQKKFAEELAKKEQLENEKTTLELENKKKQQYLLFGGVAVFVLLSFIAFRAYRQKRNDNLVIEAQKKTVERQKENAEHQKLIIEEAHREIKDSINYAERIQRSFLASDELLSSNLKDYFVYFNPKEAVSGDFYWAKELNSHNFVLLNADSTGHGVPGAIMSILNVSSVERAIEKGAKEPAEIFNMAREMIIERLKNDGSEAGGKDGMDASLLSIDRHTKLLKYVAANNPIWIIRNGELIEIKGEKMPVGKHDKDSVPFKGGEIQLKEDDVVYTLTDGFQDQFGGEKGRKFKVKPLKELLLKNAHLSLSEQKEILHNVFSKWRGNNEQVDDVCLIGFRV